MSEMEDKKMELDPEEVAAGIFFEESAGNEPVKPAQPESAPQPQEQAPEKEPVAEETPVSIPLDEYKAVLDEHFQALRALIKYTKTKDESIQKLSNELQKYREDYCAKTFKSIATLLISFREDCRRSLSDLDTFELTLDKAKKFMSFLCDDYEELLSNAGCEEDDGVWTFNGKPLNGEAVEVKFPPLFEVTEQEDAAEVTLTGDNIKEYLADAQEQIKRILADNQKLDKCLKDYCTLSTVIEADIVQLCVYPSIRKMISLYAKAKQMIDQSLSELTEQNMQQSYRAALTFLVDQVEDVLLSSRSSCSPVPLMRDRSTRIL